MEINPNSLNSTHLTQEERQELIEKVNRGEVKSITHKYTSALSHDASFAVVPWCMFALMLSCAFLINGHYIAAIIPIVISAIAGTLIFFAMKQSDNISLSRVYYPGTFQIEHNVENANNTFKQLINSEYIPDSVKDTDISSIVKDLMDESVSLSYEYMLLKNDPETAEKLHIDLDNKKSLEVLPDKLGEIRPDLEQRFKKLYESSEKLTEFVNNVQATESDARAKNIAITKEVEHARLQDSLQLEAPNLDYSIDTLNNANKLLNSYTSDLKALENDNVLQVETGHIDNKA